MFITDTTIFTKIGRITTLHDMGCRYMIALDGAIHSALPAVAFAVQDDYGTAIVISRWG